MIYLLSIIQHNKHIFKPVLAILYFFIYFFAIWTKNIFCNILLFLIWLGCIIKLYLALAYSIKKPIVLEMTHYSKRQKFFLALSLMLSANLCWIPTLIIVDSLAKVFLIYKLLPNDFIKNIGCALLLFVPLATSLLIFYALKNLIIKYNTYFKAASAFILLCFPFMFLINAYWPLDIVSFLKDSHSWGLVITVPLFLFLIEIYTIKDPES